MKTIDNSPARIYNNVMATKNKKTNTKINLILLIAGGAIFLAAATVLSGLFGFPEDETAKTQFVGITAMITWLGAFFLVFNTIRLQIKSLRNQFCDVDAKIGGNAFFIFWGCLALATCFMLVPMTISGVMEIEGGIAGSIGAFLLACVMLIPNFIKIGKQKTYALYLWYRKYEQRTTTSTTPKKTTSTQTYSRPQASYPPENSSFVSAIQSGRYGDDLYSSPIGDSDLTVRVKYDKGTYIIKPDISIIYKKENVRSQRDLDDYDRRVTEAYERAFNKMVSICEDYNVDYDIQKPNVVTNAHIFNT